MTLLEQIRDWKKDRKFPEGCEIFFAHGRPVPNVRRQLRRALAIGPRKVDTDRLWTEIGHIERRMLGALLHEAPPAPPTASTAARELAREVELQRDHIIAQARLAENPYADESEIDVLYKALREKATARALLSNKLSEDVAANISILDEMEPLLEEIVQIESRIRGLREAGQAVVKKVQDGRRIVVRRGRARGFEQYTLEDLYALSIEDLRALRKRLNDDRLKLRRVAEGDRSDGASIKQMRTQVKAEKTVAIRDREWELVNRLIQEKKHRQTEAERA